METDSKAKFQNYDEQVILAQNGNESAMSVLITAMMPLVRIQSINFSNSKIESDDLFQEGMLGIISAIHSFRRGKGANFKTYASVCVKNRMISAIRKLESGKVVQTSDCVSFSDDQLIADKFSLEEQLIIDEQYKMLVKNINEKLSVTEKSVLKLFLSGLCYDEIAKKLGSSPKSVDNALQRVRQKLKKYD
ncbi:MAG: sigma-70 family RNA polymerase sigma factor [Oscillospiraceae bacterium]